MAAARARVSAVPAIATRLPRWVMSTEQPLLQAGEMLLMRARQRRQQLVVREFQGDLFGVGLAGQGSARDRSKEPAFQAVGGERLDVHRADAADQGCGRFDMDRLQIGRAADDLARRRGPAFRTARPGSCRSRLGWLASCCDSSSFCSTSSRALLTLSAICFFAAAAGVPGRGLYLKEKHCAKSISRTSCKVASKSASLSPGKPTMKSEEKRDVGPDLRECARSAGDNRPPYAGGSSPPARASEPDCTGRCRKGISFSMAPCAAIRSSSMSRGWLVV